MKKLFTLLGVCLAINTLAAATAPADHYRGGFDNGFIFQEGAVEFAVFPDGQFDFNYIDQIAQTNFYGNNGHTAFSFNNGFNYDPFVQYDIYGAVIQIENVPVFYDGFGRIIQAGNVFINYHNGFVNRIGNLNIFYRRPGVIWRTSGFVNSFNRFYVYQPWHGFYGVPFVNNCIVWNTPYRNFYNPIRYDWAYHRVNWNRPFYYNGRYSDFNHYRNFYRPNDRVVYQSFERGRRDNRGRLVADRNTVAVRNEVATGRRAVARERSMYTVTSNNRSDASINRNNGRSIAADNVRSSTIVNERNGRSSDHATRSVETNNSSRRSNNAATTRTQAERMSTNVVHEQGSRNVSTPARRTSVDNQNSRSARTAETAAPQRTNRYEQVGDASRSVRNTEAVAPQRAVRTTPQAASSDRGNRTSTVAPSRRSGADAAPRVQPATRNNSSEVNAAPARRSSPSNNAPATRGSSRSAGERTIDRRG